MAQFVHHDRAEPDVGDFHRPPPGDERWPPLTKQRNADVGIRQVDHPSGSRSSKSPCELRWRSGIEPATRSKNPTGHPFSSTGSATTGVTVMTTSTSTFGDSDVDTQV